MPVISTNSENCGVLLGLLGMCSTVTGASTSLLFLLRVRAVYLKDTCVTIIFGALWFIVLAMNLAAYSSAGSGKFHLKSLYAHNSNRLI